MFKDGNGTGYNGSAAKFENTPFGTFLPSGMTSKADWTTSGIVAYTPFNFASFTGVEQKADNTVVGNMMDCGECHVGGGAMEYVPLSRVSLRTAAPTGFTAFNTFIDIFGPKGDGKGATYAAKTINYAQSGVLEMDCLTCHLKDYNWEARKEAVRVAGFDASRVTGAGFGHYSTSAAPSRTVTYDASKLVGDNTAGYKLKTAVAEKILAIPDSNNCASCHFANSNEKYQVEWKKRGEWWNTSSEVHGGIGCMACHQRKDLDGNGNIDPANVGTSGVAIGTVTAADKLLGLCDPAKGGDCDYDAQWNTKDKQGFKNCNDCHKSYDSTPAADSANGNTYGAPNAVAAHTAAGLLYKIAQKGTNGVKNASHLDIIDCTVCHTRKLDGAISLYNADGTFRRYSSMTLTGGAMVDGSGPDAEGRLATHDTVNVEREMKDNIVYYWKDGKMFAGNLLSSWFWRDMNGLLDINNDGRAAGLDPLLQTHVAKLIQNYNVANPTTPLHTLTEDGNVNSTELGAHIANITNATTGIKSLLGYSDPASTDAAITTATLNKVLPKFAMLGVPFKATHNIAKGNQGWGVKGCKECHSVKGTVIAANDADNTTGAAYTAPGFFDTTVDISPKTDFTYKTDQVATFTKVNGLGDATDIHPNVVDKSGIRSMPVKVVKATTPLEGAPVDNQQLNDVAKSKLIYEAVFKTRDMTWKTTITGSTRDAAGTLRLLDASDLPTGTISASGKPSSPWYDPTGYGDKAGATSTRGWLLKIEAKATGAADSTLVTRTKQVSSDTLTSVTELVANLNTGNTFCGNGAFEFTCAKAAGVDDKFEIVAKAGYEIRISKQTDVGPFGLYGKLWIAAPVTGVDAATTYAGRDAWVAYLNSAAVAGYDLDEPVAAEIATIATVPVSTGVGSGVVTAPVAATTARPANTLNAVRVNLYKGEAYTLAANATVGTVTNATANTYTWTANDGALIVTGTYNNIRAERTIADPVSAVFGEPGTYKLTLTVTNKFGESKTDFQYIQVLEKPVTSTSFDFNYAEIGATTTLTFSGAASLPAYDKVKVAWGDGTGAIIGALGTTLDHNYKRLLSYAKKSDGVTKVNGATQAEIAMYKYPTNFYFYNGNKLVTSKVGKIVQVGLLSDLVTKVRVTKTPTVPGGNIYPVRKGTDTIVVLTVTNKGPNANGNITVTLPTLPNGLSLVSMTASNRVVTGTVVTDDMLNATNTEWTITSLPKGKTAYLAIRVTLSATASADVTYTVPDTAIAATSTLVDMTANTAVSAIISPK